MSALIVARLSQAHCIATRQSAIESDTELSGIGKSKLRLVTGRTRDSLIGREPLVIKKDAAQGRPGVSRHIGRGHIVLVDNRRLKEVRRQSRRCVIEKESR